MDAVKQISIVESAPRNPPPYPVLWIFSGDAKTPPHGDGSYACNPTDNNNLRM